MRTKRFLSLLLAVAMLAAMTISASATAQSRVYFVEKFNYADTTELMENVAVSAGTGSKNSIVASDIPNVRENYDVNFFSDSTSKGYMSATTVVLGTNSRGNKTIMPTGNTFDYGNIRFIPDETWEAVEGETYVFSVELSVGPRVVGTAPAGAYGWLNGYHHATTTDAETGEDVVAYYNSTATNLTPVAAKDAGDDWSIRTAKDGNLKGAAYTFSDHENAYKYALNWRLNDAGTGMVRDTSVNGVSLEKGATNGIGSRTTVDGVYIDFRNKRDIAYGNIKLYTVKTTEGAFNVSTTVGDVVPTSTTAVPVKFSQPVEVTTYDKTAVTVTKNNEALTYGEDFMVSDITEVVNGTEVYSTAVVTFTELEPSSDYVITFPGTIANEIATTLEGYNTITFNTPEPDIKIDGFDIVKGWGTASEAAADAFVADGTLQGASIELTNTTESAKNVAVIYAVYASNGQLADVVYSNGSVAANTTATIDAGVKLAAEGSVKAFVWDGISSLKPHSEATVKTIAAAE